VAEFVSLAASLLERTQVVPSASPDADVAPVETRDGDAPLDDLALARLAALEAYQRAVPRLLAALAQDVLGRELALAPADLSRLAALACKRFEAEEPVALWVSPADERCVSSALPIRGDPALEPGDLVLEVRDGELDARFALRLAGALATAQTGL